MKCKDGMKHLPESQSMCCHPIVFDIPSRSTPVQITRLHVALPLTRILDYDAFGRLDACI